ncbi:MAG: tagaturonate epimerase family protein, partial [bacterium]
GETISSLKLNFYPYCDSLDTFRGKVYFMINQAGERRLLSVTPRNKVNDGFAAIEVLNLNNYTVKICPLTHENAVVIREIFGYTSPSVLGTKSAFGTGDRIGGAASATPGHIRAAKNYDVAVFFAQQSVRENARTGRTFPEVLDDATWGVFQEGHKGRWGADADHLMDLVSMGQAVDAGFTMFTVDPSRCINDTALNVGREELRRAFSTLFSTEKEAERFMEKYLSISRKLTNGSHSLKIEYSEKEVMRIAIQYLGAIRFTSDAYAAIAHHKGTTDFDFEMSVDETSAPTTALAHYLIIRELNDAGVRLTSLAPRFDAGFEKGVDIRTNNGRRPSPMDLKRFEDNIKDHALIARKMGPYKLGVHSGSDKFTAYPIISRYTEKMFHVKTAGTSYLEAVKVIAKANPFLYQEMHRHALETFEENRKTYHLNTNLANVPEAGQLNRAKVVEGLTENDDWRQVIHVAYGALLQKFRKRMIEVLSENLEDYYQTIADHIRVHLDGFGLKRLYD